MTELILFHHAQGLTEGVRGFADERATTLAPRRRLKQRALAFRAVL